MSKKTWFIIILIIAIVAILLASKYVAGFDEGVNNMVLQPVVAGIISLAATITANPLWLQYGYHICFITGILFTAIVALVLWPRIRQPTQKVTTTLQDKIRTTPTQIPATPQPTPVAAAPVAPIPEADTVEAEK